MGSGASNSNMTFMDFPVKATKAKSIDEIILNLRSYGNIPGQKLDEDDEPCWLQPPEEDQIAAQEIHTSPDNIANRKNDKQNATVPENVSIESPREDNKPGHDKNNKKKNNKAIPTVGHVETPQVLHSLR